MTNDENLKLTFQELIKRSKEDLKAIGYDELVIDDF